jgi:hypothetical protein
VSTNALAVLYLETSASILDTYTAITLNNAIEIISNFTVATPITGVDVVGSPTCTGTCYI